MLKRILCVILAALTAVLPFQTASAADLGVMFDNLTAGAGTGSVNKPGRYQSGARNVFTLGGVEMRAPPTSNVPSLISFTPPTGITASCSGVSAFFGGFSFISGKEFEQLLKNISSGVAQGFVAHLALKALCPYCENVAAFMQHVNQFAAQAAKNACQWGQQMAATLENSLSGALGNSDSTPSVTKACGLQVSGSGMASDFLKGMDSMCNSIGESLTNLDRTLTEYSRKLDQMNLTPAQKQQALAAQGAQVSVGNKTWMALNTMLPGDDAETLQLKTWLINLVGTTITGKSARCGSVAFSEATPGSGLLCPSTGAGLLTGEELIVGFLCGSRVPDDASRADADIVKYCKTSITALTGTQARSIYVCEDTTNCYQMSAVALSSNPQVAGKPLLDSKGMVFRVRELLTEAVRRVSSGEALVQGSGDATGKQIVALVQIAPYPLYQAINAAAVYPSASMDILSSLTILLAENLTYSFVDEMLRLSGRTSDGTQAGTAADTVKRVNDAMSHMRALQTERKAMLAQNLVVQEQLAAQIRQLNIAIQRTVMTNDVLNGNRLAATVGGSLNPTNAGNGGKPATSGQ